MKVFVAGATGVLGRPTVPALVQAGHDVRGTARGDEKSALVRSLGAEPIPVDLFDPEAVRAAVAGSEGVLNLATKIPPIMRMRWKGAWKENDRLRTDGSRTWSTPRSPRVRQCTCRSRSRSSIVTAGMSGSTRSRRYRSPGSRCRA